MKKIRKFISSIIIVTAVICVTFLTAVISKNVQKPIEINCAADLDKINSNLSGYYVFKADIDMNNYIDEQGNKKNWSPIGSELNPFTGKIDFNYHTISNLEFSNQYIESQINDKSVDDILIGFIGYSKGTLIHSYFYRCFFPRIDINCSKRIIFGVVTAINEGFVTSSIVQVEGKNGTISLNNGIIGSIVGINKNQVLLAKSVNSIYANIYGYSIVGGVIGYSQKNSINRFISRYGYLTINIFNDCNIIIGGLIGKAESCIVDEGCFGPAQSSSKPSALILDTISQCSELILGGAIGVVDGDIKFTLKNLCISNNFSIGQLYKKLIFGGIVGQVNAENLDIINCVCLSTFFHSRNSNDDLGVIVGLSINSHISSKAYYVQDSLNFNKNYSTKTTFSELSLDKLGWNTNTKTAYWTKETYSFYLNIL